MELVNTIKSIFRPRDPRRKVLLWATIVAVICGIIDVGQPVDMAMQIVRNDIRKQPVSGDIVIVGVDDKTLARLGTFPISNNPHAKVLNTLNAMGAKSVHYDIYLRKTLDPAADEAMANALRNSRVPVTLPVGMDMNPQTGKLEETTSAPMFRGLAGEVSIAARQNFFGYVVRLPFGNEAAGKLRQSMAAKLAGSKIDSPDKFMLEYSYDTASITPISFIDIFEGKAPPNQIAGKRVIVAPTAPIIRDISRYLGGYQVPGAYIHVIGAEHLKKGTPLNLGWLPLALLSVFFAASALLPERATLRLAVSLLGFPVLFLTALALEAALISISLFPAYMLLSYAIISRIWTEFAGRRTNINVETGLRNLRALRDDHARSKRLLILMTVRNYDKISSLLNEEAEVQLIEQITRRIDVGGSGMTIYQTGMGRFAWMIPPQSEAEIADQLEGIHSLFHMPFELAERPIDLDICFGIDAEVGRRMTNRYANARQAADEAGDHGQRWVRYKTTDDDALGWQLSALGELDAAIDNGQIWVAYQPQLDLESNRLTAAEALVRWSHPIRGDIRPDEFIKMAEDNNRIAKLTRFVLREAIATAALINANVDRYGKQGLFRVAVNISARMLDDRSLVATIVEELARHNLSPNALVLELTESGLLRDNARAVSVMSELRETGMGISLDDYGTGYSTMGYLRDMPANEVKIDRRFVQSVSMGGSDALLVGSTIELAHSLGKTVVAEGIEDIKTLDVLRGLDCDMAQGFFIGRPVQREFLMMKLEHGKVPAIMSPLLNQSAA